MAAQPQSGELFNDLRAFWPAPRSILEGALPSGKPCTWEIYRWVGKHRATPKAHCNSEKSFRYTVNGWLQADLCVLHAKMLAGRKSVVVTAVTA